ncbi:MAG: lipoyl(octanoyl) transferase LipB [bacterium]
MKILLPGRLSFEAALTLQERLVAQVQCGEADETLILLEHEPVYTIGRTRDRSSLREALPHAVFETNRGGQATYHGPGQLTGYPILDLSKRGRDLHVYLRFLEEYLIRLSAGFGVTAQRREGLTGVWVGERKLASLGVGVRKWISMHGFAINVLASSTDAFSSITPCGLAGVEMTSLERECGAEIDFESALHEAARLFRDMLPQPVATPST